MPINIPDSSLVVKQRIKASIQTYLETSNPFLKGSWLGAIADSLAERVYDFYYAIVAAIDEIFPDTTIDYLERWGSFYNLQPNAAKTSTGYITFQSANPGFEDPILIGQVFVDGNGNLFTAIESAEVFTDGASATTLTRSGTTATFISDKLHFLKSGNSVTVIGASHAAYNGSKVVTVVDEYTFTYTVDGAATTPATGAYFVRFGNVVAVRSDDYGIDKNLGPYTIVNLQSPVVNIYDECFVDGDGLTGAQDSESIESFRSRVLDVIRNPVAHFNDSDISRLAKTIAGITRVFVKQATPAAGQVTIYITTDNDTSPIPSAALVSEVKQKLLTIKPANISDDDLIVAAPGQEVVNFTFTAISPNTSTMRSSIIENLKQFFADNTSVGIAIVEDAYRSAIFSTIDVTTGEQVVSFTLSSPSGTVTPAANELPILGTVTWP